MVVLITYDVETSSKDGQRRLRRVAKQCVNYGQRVQNSVFECSLDPGQFAELRFRLQEIINKETDSVRFYFLGNNWKRRIEYIGKLTSYDITDGLII